MTRMFESLGMNNEVSSCQGERRPAREICSPGELSIILRARFGMTQVLCHMQIA